MNRQFLLIYCALNAAFTLLGLALCGAGFFGSGSFGMRALAWLLSLEAGFLGAFGAVYFSFRAYRNKIEDELRAGKYDEILRQSPKNSAGFMNDEIPANDANSASSGGENRGSIGGDDKISYSEVYGGEILKSESFRGVNSGAEISNAQNSEGAVNFTSGETHIENGNSHALCEETAAECAASSTTDEDTENFTAERDVNSTKSDDKTSACDATALERTVADKFEMTCGSLKAEASSEVCGDFRIETGSENCKNLKHRASNGDDYNDYKGEMNREDSTGGAICGNSYGGISDEASDSSQGGIGARCDDLKNAASSDLGGGLDSSESGDGTSDFGGGISGARDRSNDDFDGADGSIDGWDDERKRGEVRSNFAGAFFSPFKILSYVALVAAIYLLAKLSLLNPLAIILGVTIIPLGTMIVAFADKDAR